MASHGHRADSVPFGGNVVSDGYSCFCKFAGSLSRLQTSTAKNRCPRHRGGLDLAQHYFPNCCVSGDIIDRYGVEREVGRSQTLVVAGDAVLIEEGSLR